jgi:hypothetical protein
MTIKKHKKNMASPVSEYEVIMIQGIVIPTDWDEKGNIIDIAVSTFDEDVYHIENDERGRQLMSLIREEVEIKGTIKHKDGLKKIKVDMYISKKREESELKFPHIA